MKSRIFISSVQREFAKGRKALAEYVRKDAILGCFFDVFLFEEIPAQERKAEGVYLAEVDACGIYLGIFGHTYGNTDSAGVSATEREYLCAAKHRKERICHCRWRSCSRHLSSLMTTARCSIPPHCSSASVQVMLFRDRLEVWSPGSLPRGMTIAKLSTTHKSVPVNPLLARAMYLKGYIEKSGTGTEDMIAKCAVWGIPVPEWLEDDDDFRVVLRRPNGVNAGQSGSGGRVPATTQQTTQETTQQISNRRLLQLVPPGNMRNIVSLVMKNPYINIDGMAEMLGLTSNGIKYHIKRLRAFIKFKHVGALQAGHWEIGPKP